MEPPARLGSARRGRGEREGAATSSAPSGEGSQPAPQPHVWRSGEVAGSQLGLCPSPAAARFLAQPTTWRRKNSSTFCFKRPWTIFCCSTPFAPPFQWTKGPKRRMRQLRGKPKKETSKDKKERKQAMQEARQQITTVVLPTLAVVVLLIVVFVYVATRPNTTEWCSFSDFLALGY